VIPAFPCNSPLSPLDRREDFLEMYRFYQESSGGARVFISASLDLGSHNGRHTTAAGSGR
jgi:hypothetical protein